MTEFVTLEAEWLQYVNLLAAVLLPALVALITARLAESWIKTVALAATTAILSVLVLVLDSGGFTPSDVVFLFLQNFATAVIAHYGALRHIGLSGSNSPVASTDIVVAGHDLAIGGKHRYEGPPLP